MVSIAARPALTVGRRWVSLTLLASAIAGGGALRTLFSPLQELAKHDLQLTDLQLSLVQGVAVSIPIALLSLPIGRLVDKGNRSRLLLALIAVSVLGTLLTTFVQGFAGLFVARMLAGLGGFCSIPVAISMAADLSVIEGRGRSLLVLSLGQYVGVAAAFALGGWFAGRLGAPHGTWFPGFELAPWREVHLAFGVAALMLLLALLSLREPARHELGDVVHPDLHTTLQALWSRRAFLAPLFVGQIGVVMADLAAGMWAAPVLTRNFGLRPEEFAASMGLAVLLPGVLGSIVGGVAADAGQRSHRRGGILFAAVIAAFVAVPAAFFPSMPSAATFTTALSVFLFCGTVTGLVTATTLAVYVPNELRGLCLGAFVIVSSVIGMGVAPTLVTIVSGALGGEAYLASALALAGAVVSVIAAIAFVVAASRLPRTAHA